MTNCNCHPPPMLKMSYSPSVAAALAVFADFLADLGSVSLFLCTYSSAPPPCVAPLPDSLVPAFTES